MAAIENNADDDETQTKQSLKIGRLWKSQYSISENIITKTVSLDNRFRVSIEIKIMVHTKCLFKLAK